MPLSIQQVDEIFSYHKPTEEVLPRYKKLREMAREFAHLINGTCPESREKSLALTSLQETVMWANASIAIHETPREDT